MNTDTPETNEALAAILDKDGYLSEDNAPDVLVKLSRTMERERDNARERVDTMFAKFVDILEQTRNERDEWKAKYIQQNKDLGCEMMDPNGTIWDYAKKLQKDIAAINDRRDQFEGRLRVELGGHPDSELWGDAGLIAATMRCVDALDAVTEQRDRLAAVLEEACDNPTTGNWYREARAALAAWKEARK